MTWRKLRYGAAHLLIGDAWCFAYGIIAGGMIYWALHHDFGPTPMFFMAISITVTPIFLHIVLKLLSR